MFLPDRSVRWTRVKLKGWCDLTLHRILNWLISRLHHLIFLTMQWQREKRPWKERRKVCWRCLHGTHTHKGRRARFLFEASLLLSSISLFLRRGFIAAAPGLAFDSRGDLSIWYFISDCTRARAGCNRRITIFSPPADKSVWRNLVHSEMERKICGNPSHFILICGGCSSKGICRVQHENLSKLHEVNNQHDCCIFTRLECTPCPKSLL